MALPDTHAHWRHQANTTASQIQTPKLKRRLFIFFEKRKKVKRMFITQVVLEVSE